MSSPSHAVFKAQRHFGSLDGLRALSIIAVIWHHTMTHSDSAPWMRAGAHGVTLFFAISGFLIVTLLLREHDANGGIDLKAFYMRRSLRIFPLYYAVVLLYVLLVFLMERNSPDGREFFDNLKYFATYTSNWFVALEGRVIFYFSWSLAAEEQFYLVWPSIEKFLKPMRALFAMAAVIAVVALAQWMGPPGGSAVPLWYRIIDSVPLAICFGVVLAHALHGEQGYRWLAILFAWRWGSLAYLLLAAGAMGAGAPTPVVHLCLALVVGACVYREDHVLARILRWKWLAHIGMVSYGMYLLHMLAKNAVDRALHMAGIDDARGLVFVATLAVTTIAATASFRYFESYFLRRKPKSRAAIRADSVVSGRATP